MSKQFSSKADIIISVSARENFFRIYRNQSSSVNMNSKMTVITPLLIASLSTEILYESNNFLALHSSSLQYLLIFVMITKGRNVTNSRTGLYIA